tara:strand:+ start:12680 stop:13078 length:399 start_codon:yes stop_codon:yes gene_type:complete
MSKADKLVVKRSSAGLGLFAAAPFKKDECVIEYTGEFISADEANRRGGKYLFELNDTWAIDGKGRENIARYINHSCKPNCEPILSHNEKQVHIHAKRNIKTGEELTYYYGKDYFNRIIKPAGCRCEKCSAKK